MKKKNIIAVVIALLIGGYLAFSEVKTATTIEKSPEALFLDAVENTRYYSVEDVAKMIISKDPLLQLIDLRSEKEYQKFTLKGAVNIPLDQLLKKENLSDYFDQDVYNTVLFTNGSTHADAAWMILTRMGFSNIYVMKGGLNAWAQNILKPKPAEGPWDVAADELYQYRRGASQYFGGGKAVVSESSAPPKTKKKKVIKRKKKEVAGGCG